MSNSTQSWGNLPVYVVYMVQGSVIGVGNLLIALSIARYSALRTEKGYIIIMGLAGADFILLSAYLMAGIRRTLLLIAGTHDDLLTPWQCMTSCHNLLWSFANHLSSVMLLVISFDRLCSILWPLSYLGWSANYAKSMIFTVYSITISAGVYGIVRTYGYRNQIPNIPARCLPVKALSQTTGPLFSFYFTFGPQIYACVSIVFYLAIGVVYKKKTAQVAPEQQQYELAQQRKITRSLGISCVCTFLFYVLPYNFAQLSIKFKFPSVLPVIFYSTSNLNPMCNLIIYSVRHREIRQAVYGMFRGKTRPDNLKLWNNTTV